MVICGKCSDPGFVGYVCAIPFSTLAERDAWGKRHIAETGHMVLYVGCWLSPHDTTAYARSFDWAAAEDAAGRGLPYQGPDWRVCTDHLAEIELGIAA